MSQLTNMIYFASVKAVPVNQSHVIALFYITCSFCSREASTDKSQLCTAAFCLIYL